MGRVTSTRLRQTVTPNCEGERSTNCSPISAGPDFNPSDFRTFPPKGTQPERDMSLHQFRSASEITVLIFDREAGLNFWPLGCPRWSRLRVCFLPIVYQRVKRERCVGRSGDLKMSIISSKTTRVGRPAGKEMMYDVQAKTADLLRSRAPSTAFRPQALSRHRQSRSDPRLDFHRACM